MTKAETILVVDDHEANLFGLRDYLRRSNYTVYTTTDGSEAIRIARDELPDAVLLDVMMPGISGLDVCAELKRHIATRLIPVVLMSGMHERAARIAGLAAGADDFLAKPIDVEELSARVRSLVRLKRATDELESAEALFLALGRVIEARDPSTEGHCDRLASYALALGESLDLPQSDLDTLYRGGFLHDIGKIAIPDRILLKKGRLTKREYELMKCHPVIGDELCATVRSFESVRAIVRHHHERLDGTGYPDGLVGGEIPLLAQIVTVVDIFDALTTKRSYRKALPHAAAYDILRAESREGAYSEELVERFIDLHRGRGKTLTSSSRSSGCSSRHSRCRCPSAGPSTAPC